MTITFTRPAVAFDGGTPFGYLVTCTDCATTTPDLTLAIAHTYPVGASTNDEEGFYCFGCGVPLTNDLARCDDCGREIHALEVFPHERCVNCHEKVTPFPTAKEVRAAFGIR